MTKKPERNHDCDDQQGEFCACGAALCEHGYEIPLWIKHECSMSGPFDILACITLNDQNDKPINDPSYNLFLMNKYHD